MEIIKCTYQKILVAEQKLTNILLLTAYARGCHILQRVRSCVATSKSGMTTSLRHHSALCAVINN